MKVKKWVALLLAGTMALSAAGCGGTKDTASSSADESRVTETAANAGENSQAAETNAENSNYGGTLKIGLQNAIVHLGYVHTGLGTSEAMILDTCCEHLCRYAEDGTLTPWLCTAYEEDRSPPPCASFFPQQRFQSASFRFPVPHNSPGKNMMFFPFSSPFPVTALYQPGMVLLYKNSAYFR